MLPHQLAQHVDAAKVGKQQIEDDQVVGRPERGREASFSIGGQVDVAPGSTTDVELTGPTPLGTIAAAVFEVTAQVSPP